MSVKKKTEIYSSDSTADGRGKISYRTLMPFSNPEGSPEPRKSPEKFKSIALG